MSLRIWLVAPLFLAAVFLAHSIEAGEPSGVSSFTLNDSLYRLVGSAKEAIGDTLFLKADAYFHGGVEDKHDTDEEREETGYIEPKGSHADDFGTDWIARVNGQVHSHEHIHLAASNQVEMLPFFALATTLDPHNVEAILTGAYWLDSHFNKTDEAIALLKRGSAANPDSWEIPYNLGLIYFKEKKNFAESERYLRLALKNSQGQDVMRHQMVDIHYYLAESLVAEGRKEEALPFYRGALAFYDSKTDSKLRDRIRDKIRELEGFLL